MRTHTWVGLTGVITSILLTSSEKILKKDTGDLWDSGKVDWDSLKTLFTFLFRFVMLGARFS
jgi:hypothetical protein